MFTYTLSDQRCPATVALEQALKAWQLKHQGLVHAPRLWERHFCAVVVVVDRFYIALFSVLEQTHCTRM